MHHYLDEHSREALSRLTRQSETATVERKESVAYALPVLAKATSDVGTNTLGTFTLYHNKPVSLSLGSTTRQAYALSDITAGEKVELQRFAGEDSGGFWAASKVLTGASEPAVQEDVAQLEQCVCRLKALLAKEIELSGNLASTFAGSTTMEDEIDNVTLACGCSAITGYESCTTATGGQIPMPVTVTIGGVLVPYQGDTIEPKQAALREWINGVHEFTEDDWQGCWGAKTLYEDPNSPSIWTRLGTIIIRLGDSGGANGWVIELHNDHVEALPPVSNDITGGTLQTTNMTDIAKITGHTVTPHYGGGVDSFAYEWIDARGITGSVAPADATDPTPPPPPVVIPFDPAAGHAVFDGTDDYVDLGTAITITGDFTLTITAATQDITTNAVLGNGATNQLQVTGAAQVTLDVNSTSMAFTTPAAIDDGIFHEFEFKRVGSTITLKVDGVSSVSSGTEAGTMSIRYLGGRDASNVFDGKLAQVVINATHQYDFDEAQGTAVVNNANPGTNDGTATLITQSTFWVPYTG